MNREQRAAYQAAYYAAHREQRAAYRAAYYAAHRDRLLEYQRTRRAKKEAA